jgi:hypothetical protein
MDRSFNGGLTWGTDLPVQSTTFAQATINPQLLIFAYPAMDVDVTNGPNRGKIYVAYTNAPNGDADIFFTSSGDSGSHWTTPIRVNDDAIGNGADQFHPWLVCDENGNLHLIFYDRRLNLPQNLLMDVFYTHSENGGLTWAPNQRITDVSSNPAYDSLMVASGLIGEYNGLAVRNGNVHPIWTDTRYLNQDAFTAVFQASPPLDITLTPLNPPITVPATGGSFNFNVSLIRSVGPQAPYSVWARLKNPDGSYTAPVLGPVTINTPVGVTITRQRNQTIPGSWPPGVYSYLGYANTTFSYPAVDSSSFPFTKLATGSGPYVWEATCSGELFPGEQPMAAFIPSGLDLKVGPNPFNPTTAISYELRAASRVNLKVYDTAGRLVAILVDGQQEAGSHQATFDGSHLASGIYLAKLQAGESSAVQKLVLLK